MNKNLLIGVSVNFTTNNLKNLILSFREVNKVDDIILFVDPINLPILKENFSNYGVIFKPYNFYEFVDTPVHNTRYIKYLEFLSDQTEYKNILLCDTKDVIFQHNPFDNLPDEFLYFFKEDSGIKIADDYHCNSWWIYSSYGQDILQQLAYHNIICSGTILGSFNEIIKLLITVKDELLKIKKEKPDVFKGIILDQAIINYLGHINPYGNKNLEVKSNGDVIGTLGTTFGSVQPHGSLPIPIDQVLINGSSIMVNNLIPAIIHQYDRQEMIKRIIDLKYQL